MPADTTEIGVPDTDGIYGWVPEDIYHADQGSLSVSGAKLLLPPSCPAKFKERMDNPPPAKRHFEFGHLVHLEVLGKGVETVELPFDDYRTKAAREARDDARARGKVPVLVGPKANDDIGVELAKARTMADKIRNDPEAGPLFARGHAEKSLYWTDPDSGVRLRGRVDWLTTIDGRLTCVDLKTSTTANPAELERKFWQHCYHMQNAWYRRLLIELGMSDDPDFVFVVAEKEPPFAVTVVRYDQEAIAEGDRLNRQAIDLYVECRTANHWPEYTDHSVTLSLPYVALKARDQAIYNEAVELERNWDDFFNN